MIGKPHKPGNLIGMAKLATSCEVCDKSILYWPSRPRRYCSYRCSGLAKTNRGKEEGIALYKSGLPSRKVAERFGVDQKTVLNWVHSVDFRRTQSDGQSGENNPNYGKPMSKEHKEKISRAQRGRRFTVAHRHKLSQAKRGLNWKGYKSAVRNAIRGTFEYKEWRNAVFLRDKYTCCECSKRGKLHAHHLTSLAIIVGDLTFDEAVKQPLLWNIDNGETLCVTCHRKTSSYGNRGVR